MSGSDDLAPFHQLDHSLFKPADTQHPSLHFHEQVLVVQHVSP
jgi:hypothetical protein